jgi:hypothetical protein
VDKPDDSKTGGGNIRLDQGAWAIETDKAKGKKERGLEIPVCVRNISSGPNEWNIEGKNGISEGEE